MPKIPLLEALRLPLRILPDRLHTEVLARTLNHVLRGQPLAARLPELEGRSICLDVRDAGATLRVRILHGRFAPAGAGPSLVTIRGDVRDFLDLATRAEDADTLFFNRRLCIEGDTETGLHVKNLLDSLHYDWQAHLRSVLAAPIAAAVSGLAQRCRAGMRPAPVRRQENAE